MALFVVSLLPGTLAGQAPALSVVPGRETEAGVAPGQIFTLPFQLSAGGERLRLVPEIDLPEGWKLMAGSRPMALEPGGASLWLVSLGVPGGAPAGVHAIPLRIRAEGAAAPLFEDTLRLAVEEKARVQLRILSSPGYAIAEDTVSLRFLVANQGNAPAEFRVQVGGDALLRPDRPDTLMVLAPGALAERTVVLRAGSADRSRAARVEVRAVGLAKASVRDSVATEVVVVPTTRRTEGMYHHLPARLRLRAADGGQAPVLGELSGGGRLLDGRGPEVSFYLRSLGGSDPLMQERDQYSVDVRGERYEVRLGDQHFSTGALGGSGRTGFGAGGSATRGRLTAGGFVSRSREIGVAQGEQSAFATYRLGESQEVTTRLSRMEDAYEGGTLATLAYAASPLPGAEVRLEYGAGRSAEGSGSGYSVDVRGDHQWLSYSVAHRAGDGSLPGPFQGVRSTSGSLALSPARGISLGASAGGYSREAAATPFSTSSAGRSLTVHADFGGAFGAEYRRSEWSSGVRELDGAQGESAFRLRAGTRFGALSMNGSAEMGERSDPVTGLPARYTDVTAMPALTLGGATLSGYARHLQGRGAEPVPEEGWSLGANLSGALVPSLRVSLGAASRAPVRIGAEREQRLEARIDQSLPGEHLLSLRAQTVRGDAVFGQRNGLSLEYSIPLKIRAGRANTPGRVVGRVTDGESGAGLGGVVVRLQDQLMVTDRAGYVVFSSVGAGAHPLGVTRSRRAGQVAIGDSLVMVEGAAAPQPFHLRMVAGAHLRGSVRLLARAASATEDELTDGGGLENIVLVLQSATDTMFLVTDPHGNFDAGQVRPGRWSIAHVGGTLPALYAFEKARIEFMVAAGEDRDIRMVVRPKHRDIQMIASGEVLVMASPAPQRRETTPARPALGTITDVAILVSSTRRAAPAAPRPAAAAVAMNVSPNRETWRPRAAAPISIGGSTADAIALLSAPAAAERAPASSHAGIWFANTAAPAGPGRSTAPAAISDEAYVFLARRDGEDDPPERPPPRQGHIPWDPRVPWDAPRARAGPIRSG